MEYLQTMKGTAVARMVVLLPMPSMRGPPAMPPPSALSGITLPIQDHCGGESTVG